MNKVSTRLAPFSGAKKHRLDFYWIFRKKKKLNPEFFFPFNYSFHMLLIIKAVFLHKSRILMLYGFLEEKDPFRTVLIVIQKTEIIDAIFE